MTTTTTTGVFFLRKQRPVEATRDPGGFRLTLRLIDRQAPGAAEAYVVVWHGAPAERWWQEHGQSVGPGTPLEVHLHNPRTFPHPGAPEIRATVWSLKLAPVAPSWHARSSGNSSFSQPSAGTA